MNGIGADIMIIDEMTDVSDDTLQSLEVVLSKATAPAKPVSWYRQHELAIWLTVVGLLVAAYCLSLANNADLMWRLSTPVMEVLP